MLHCLKSCQLITYKVTQYPVVTHACFVLCRICKSQWHWNSCQRSNLTFRSLLNVVLVLFKTHFKVYISDITILGFFMFRCTARTMAKLVFRYEFSFSYFFCFKVGFFPQMKGHVRALLGSTFHSDDAYAGSHGWSRFPKPYSVLSELL